MRPAKIIQLWCKVAVLVAIVLFVGRGFSVASVALIGFATPILIAEAAARTQLYQKGAVSRWARVVQDWNIAAFMVALFLWGLLFGLERLYSLGLGLVAAVMTVWTVVEIRRRNADDAKNANTMGG